ncbi:hypothetical protein [Intestinimonas massiliensis (ex Afouda et al. 2020)]|uniref:hypothetical protein n=1 Tax=Intestinimonas massiliensis (ex Afouda et al. 2020) TaxID=1673721 RepID=UPI001030A79F|nr:hypothetical protein [Intestinimonas massiliensis (ex Afouda et al. 2020)]
MTDTYAQPLVEMGITLAELAVKGTASAVNKKIRAAKEIKDAEKLRTTYDELINEVLQEREEAIRIAQAYKSELDRIIISDEDIEHLNLTATRLLDIIKSFSPGTNIEGFEAIKDLISVDTLKTMQLLGFNYKAAIGEPLTQLCANAISSLWNKKNSQSNGRVQNRR